MVRTRCEKGWEFWGEDVDGELERPDPELMTNAKPRSIDQLEWNEGVYKWGFPKRHLHDACLHFTWHKIKYELVIEHDIVYLQLSRIYKEELTTI